MIICTILTFSCATPWWHLSLLQRTLLHQLNHTINVAPVVKVSRYGVIYRGRCGLDAARDQVDIFWTHLAFDVKYFHKWQLILWKWWHLFSLRPALVGVSLEFHLHLMSYHISMSWKQRNETLHWDWPNEAISVTNNSISRAMWKKADTMAVLISSYGYRIHESRRDKKLSIGWQW